jgi:hypothetical protein
MLETAVLSALAPAFIDGIRGLVAKWTGSEGAKPQNLDEVIKLMEAENNRFRIIAELDKPVENISKWVADLRASFRYIAATLIIIGTMAGWIVNEEPMVVVCAFLFGERFYLKFKAGFGTKQ